MHIHTFLTSWNWFKNKRLGCICVWQRCAEVFQAITRQVCRKSLCINRGQACWQQCPVEVAETGPWFNIKMQSYQYRKSYCGDKTVVRSSYLHNGISFTGKMTYFYWSSPLVRRWQRVISLQWHHIRSKASKLLATRLFISLFIHTVDKETSKFHMTGPLHRESIAHSWMPLKMTWNAEMVHFMTSSLLLAIGHVASVPINDPWESSLVW